MNYKPNIREGMTSETSQLKNKPAFIYRFLALKRVTNTYLIIHTMKLCFKKLFSQRKLIHKKNIYFFS